MTTLGRMFVAVVTLCVHPVFGGVVLDASFGMSGALPGPNYMIQASFGKQVGTNLFHSFSQFDLISSESATFTGPSNIQNILARVTSGSASSIDGLVRSDIAGANLFLLNPAGVIFGSHAQIDVSGSFAVSTANYVKLADGGKFNTSLGGQDVLTAAPVSAFGFLNATPAAVSVTGSTLNIAPAKSFSVVAGDIGIDAGKITGEGARVNLVSVQSAGEAQLDATNLVTPLDVTQFTTFGEIDLTDLAQITVSGPQGGGVNIRAGKLSLNNSDITSQTMGGLDGLAFDVVLSGELELVNGASITSDTLASGNGSNLSIQAQSFSIDGSASPGLFIGITAQSSGAATGNAGNLDITIDQALNIVGHGEISSSTFSSGNGGNLALYAGSLSIDGSATSDKFSGISSGSNSGATGDAGDVFVKVAGALTITGTGEISVATFSSGSGGNLTLRAGSLLIDGSADPDHFTGIAAASNAGATGNAGSLTIMVDDALNIVGAGEISVDTFSSGSGGSLTLRAGSLLIDGSAAPDKLTGISSSSNPGATGNAGNMTISVNGAVGIIGAGEISGATFSNGSGGDLTLHAGSLSIDGSLAPDKFTGISSGSNPGATGDSGNVSVDVDAALSITGAGEISLSTSSSGSGGDLTLHAGSLSIDGSAAPNSVTGIFADAAAGTGKGGELNVTVDRLLTITDGGQISADTFSSGKGGNLDIQAGSLSIDGSDTPEQFGGISADSNPGAKGDAGNLTITVRDALSVVGGGQVTADTYSDGKGGDLTIQAGSLLVDGSTRPDCITGITAEAVEGTGDAGDLTIIVSGGLTVTGGAQISADTCSSGEGGNLSIRAGSILLDGSANVDFFTGISADALEGTGDAGDLTIIVSGGLTVTGGAQISADTYTSGEGGNLSIRAGSILLDGSGTDLFTGISADALDGTGNGGNLTVAVDGLLCIRGGGRIATDTFTSGNGGDVTIRAGSISIDGSARPEFFTGISAETEDGSGKGGNLSVAANNVLLDGGSISASSLTPAGAGAVVLSVGSLSMDSCSSISSKNTGTGLAGSVTINSMGAMELSHESSISTSSDVGDAGSIELTAGGVIRLSDQSSITASAGADGGNIHLTAPGLVYLTDSSISATAGNGGNGTGGNITIDHPQFIILKNTLISANATIGQGGNINLISDFFFNSKSSITATGTTNGTVNITAPDLDLGAVLVALPSSLLSAETQLRERCTAQLRGDFSSFITLGRGGTEPAPDELQPAF